MSQEDSFVDNSYGVNTPGYQGQATPGYQGQATPAYGQPMSQPTGTGAAAATNNGGFKKKFGREWIVPEVLCRRKGDASAQDGVIRASPRPDGMVSVQFGTTAPQMLHLGDIEPVIDLHKDDRVYILLPANLRGFGSLLDLQPSGLIVELEGSGDIEMPSKSDIVKAHKR